MVAVVPVVKVVQVVTGGPATVKGAPQVPKPETQGLVVVCCCQLYGPVPPETVAVLPEPWQTVSAVQGFTVMLVVALPQARV
jgi:hypothetical protein